VGRLSPKGRTVVQQSEHCLSGKYDFMSSKIINYSAKYNEIQYLIVFNFVKVHNFPFTLFIPCIGMKQITRVTPTDALDQ
jgi:hypothetical protein